MLGIEVWLGQLKNFSRKKFNENLKNDDSVSKFTFLKQNQKYWAFHFFSTTSKIISLNHDSKTTFILSFREIKSFSKAIQSLAGHKVFFLDIRMSMFHRDEIKSIT